MEISFLIKFQQELPLLVGSFQCLLQVCSQTGDLLVLQFSPKSVLLEILVPDFFFHVSQAN